MIKRNFVFSILSVVFVLLSWEVFAYLIDSPFLLPRVKFVIKDFFTVIFFKGFFLDLGKTCYRGLYAFLISLICALFIGLFAGTFKPIEIIIRPWMTIIKSTPVVSIILLAVLWFGSDYVPIFVSILMTLPIMTESIQQGVKQTDRSLLEMSEVYRFSFFKTLIHIRLPSVFPFFLSGAGASLGLTWKVVIAGEILSLPRFGIGTAMQTAKVQLETTRVFSLTCIAIFLSVFTDSIFYYLLKIVKNKRNFEN